MAAFISQFFQSLLSDFVLLGQTFEQAIQQDDKQQSGNANKQPALKDTGYGQLHRIGKKISGETIGNENPQYSQRRIGYDNQRDDFEAAVAVVPGRLHRRTRALFRIGHCNGLENLKLMQEDIDDIGVEVGAAPFADDVSGGIETEGVLVNALRDQCIEDIGQRH